MHAPESRPDAGPADAAAPRVEIDPVCGMKVNPDAARGGSHEHAGKTYYFCNPRCRERFAAEPERFLKARVEHDAPHGHTEHTDHGRGHGHAYGHGDRERADALSIEYTCPMHPEVVQMGPGACPICGMALEPKNAAHAPRD
jgi:P-type Cu+ transporter